MIMIFINGGLPKDPAQRRGMQLLYNELGEIVLRNGFEPYISSFVNSPHKNRPYPEPSEIRKRQRRAVSQSSLAIIYTGIPFIDLGIDIELAFHASTPIIIIYENEVKATEKGRVSEPMLGHPGIIERVEFSTFREVQEEIKIFIAEFSEKLKKEKLPSPLQPYHFSSV